jgi:hypothetical protein
MNVFDFLENSHKREETIKLALWFSKLNAEEQMIVANELVFASDDDIRNILDLPETERVILLMHKNVMERYLMAPALLTILNLIAGTRTSFDDILDKALVRSSKKPNRLPHIPHSFWAVRHYLLGRTYYKEHEFRKSIDYAESLSRQETGKEGISQTKPQILKDKITEIVKIVLSAGGAIKIIVELIKSWVEDRKGRKIRLKKGDFELEIQGGMSQKEIEKRVKQFSKILKDDDDINIILS